jgi:hypothetical protein
MKSGCCESKRASPTTIVRAASGARGSIRPRLNYPTTAALGAPLDLEWAVDPNGRVSWLQARPITHLPADVRELDARWSDDDIFTKCNIGEMLPGAVTPLTWSISVRGIDYGMQAMYLALGAQPRLARIARGGRRRRSVPLLLGAHGPFEAEESIQNRPRKMIPWRLECPAES